jgi:hypothetical protein
VPFREHSGLEDAPSQKEQNEDGAGNDKAGVTGQMKQEIHASQGLGIPFIPINLIRNHMFVESIEQSPLIGIHPAMRSAARFP